MVGCLLNIFLIIAWPLVKNDHPFRQLADLNAEGSTECVVPSAKKEEVEGEFWIFLLF